MGPLEVNALLAIIVLFIFFLVGIYQFRNISNYDDFFLRSRSLSSSEYSDSYAAASTSLATVLIFFIEFGSQFGFALLFAPATVLLGVWLFCKLASKMSSHDLITQGTSLGAYLTKAYDSRIASRSISFIAMLGLASILLLEFYIGISIFSLYFQTTRHAAIVALTVIAILVFFYVSLGGFAGVVRTDRLQYRLMWTAVLAGILYLFARLPHSSPGAFAAFPAPLFGDGVLILPFSLLLNMLAVNLLLLPAQLRTWQMAASCRDYDSMRRGLYKGAATMGFLWMLFVLLSLLVRAEGVVSPISLVGLLDAWSRSSNDLIAFGLFPLLFCACLAALVSTADSAVVPVVQTIVDDYLSHFRDSLWVARLLIIAVMLVVIALYVVVFEILGWNFIPLLFTVLGIVIVLAPAIITAMLVPTRSRHRAAPYFALASVWVGLAVTLGISYYGNQVLMLGIVQYAAPLGTLIAAALIAPIWFLPEAAKGKV